VSILVSIIVKAIRTCETNDAAQYVLCGVSIIEILLYWFAMHAAEKYHEKGLRIVSIIFLFRLYIIRKKIFEMT
jgi:hypothetical protein